MEIYDFNDSLQESGQSKYNKKPQKGVEQKEYDVFVQQQLSLRRVRMPFMPDSLIKEGIKRDWNKRHPHAPVFKRTVKRTLISKKAIKQLVNANLLKKNRRRVSFNEEVTVKPFVSSQVLKKKSMGSGDQGFRDFFNQEIEEEEDDDDWISKTCISKDKETPPKDVYEKKEEESLDVFHGLSPIPHPEEENAMPSGIEDGRATSLAGGDSSKMPLNARSSSISFRSEESTVTVGQSVKASGSSVFSFPEQKEVKTYSKYKLPPRLTSTPKVDDRRGQSTSRDESDRNDDEYDEDLESMIPKKRMKIFKKKNKTSESPSNSSMDTIRVPLKDKPSREEVVPEESLHSQKENRKKSVAKPRASKKMSVLVTVIPLVLRKRQSMIMKPILLGHPIERKGKTASQTVSNTASKAPRKSSTSSAIPLNPRKTEVPLDLTPLTSKQTTPKRRRNK